MPSYLCDVTRCDEAGDLSQLLRLLVCGLGADVSTLLRRRRHRALTENAVAQTVQHFGPEAINGQQGLDTLQVGVLLE